MRQYEGHNRLQCQGVYCVLSTASEVILGFTYQLYTFSCMYDALLCIDQQEGSIATELFPALNTPLSSLPVGIVISF